MPVQKTRYAVSIRPLLRKLNDNALIMRDGIFRNLTKIQTITIVGLICYAFWELIVLIWKQSLPPSDPVIRGDLAFIYPLLAVLIVISLIQLLKRRNTRNS